MFDWFRSAAKPPPARGPRVSSFLLERGISFFTAGPSKQQVFGQLIASLDLPDPSAALKAILAREEAGSTILAPGFALPHARLTGLKSLQAALGLCPAGVIDPRAQAEPVKVYLLFLGPADNMKEHLAFLAAASALFQSPELVQRLLKLSSPIDVLQSLRAAEGK